MSPRYPIYVISKGRADNCLTAKFLVRDDTPFSLVIEPQEEAKYAHAFGGDVLRILPFSNLGLGSIPARNWVWEDSRARGCERHWIIDDNIYDVEFRYQGKRIVCNSGPALAAVEDFVDRYENIAIGGLNYHMFAPAGRNIPPFVVNCHVYSCLLIRNDLPYRWRGRYNEDTDLCLQVLSGSWCTVLTNAFLIHKVPTMKMKGGNTAELYQDNGRLKMARSLERMWPGVVETHRRFHRAQHVIKDAWGRFNTPLKLRADAPPADPAKHALALQQVKGIKSESLRQWYAAQQVSV
jgi:hypothetical protein